MDIKRNCAVCKGKIAINGVDRSNCIYFQRKWYHKQCFTDFGLTQNDKKWEKALENYETLCVNTDQHIREMDVKDQIYRHMLEHYHMTFIPSYVFVRLNSLYDGSMKGLAQPIPPEHLLDMWQQKQKWLDKHYQKQKKHIDGVQRICYDLAILAGKYGSYLSWLDKHTAEAQQARERANTEIKVDYNSIRTNSVLEDNDITSIMDEVF